LRDEINRVLGKRTEITYEDITELKYCASVFKEALRLWPPAAVISRCNTEDMVIEGYKIPKNSWIQVNNTS
jgi:cytochrome P450